MDSTTRPRTKTLMLAAAVLAGVVASGSALAQRHSHGGPRVSVGFYVGAPFYPHYYSPHYYRPYYYPPVVVVPATPPVYIEQAQPQAAPQQPPAGWWYYCAEGQGYYPYVKQCPGGWQQVAPQPPG